MSQVVKMLYHSRSVWIFALYSVWRLARACSLAALWSCGEAASIAQFSKTVCSVLVTWPRALSKMLV